jgi:hypothetical protein
MGVYDWVNCYVKCPNCGFEKITEFQTKGFGSHFEELQFGQKVIVEDDRNIDFIASCFHCDCMMYAIPELIDTEDEELKIFGSLIMYKYCKSIQTVNLNECYCWDKIDKTYIKVEGSD